MADKEFSLEELDRMYDEAMKWEPPQVTSNQATTDPKATLQKLISARQKSTETKN